MSKEMVCVEFLDTIDESACYDLEGKLVGHPVDIEAMILSDITTRDRAFNTKIGNFSSRIKQAQLDVAGLVNTHPAFRETLENEKDKNKSKTKTIENTENKPLELLQMAAQLGIAKDIMLNIFENFNDIYKSYFQGGMPKTTIPFKVIDANGKQYLPPANFMNTLYDTSINGEDALRVMDGFYFGVLAPRLEEVEKKKATKKITIYS